MVADTLLEFLDVRKAAHLSAGPHSLITEPDFENTAGAWSECYGFQFAFEGDEQFLRHPRSAQQPPTLGAILDF